MSINGQIGALPKQVDISKRHPHSLPVHAPCDTAEHRLQYGTSV
ncbi:unnamed protein product [Staurois parvus]|uniref:Uncharacterized protein n=1 Tax=Staurois parvus TaxID=386267 RepID=A0ABN9FCF3_9NEOB|nr:unnamed protein product [Staurois parvus]